MKPLFSVVLIAKNEARNLPRLVASLKEFQSLGGEIVLADTGSTDGTAELARSLGCKVFEEGERFIKTIPAELADQINAQFVVPPELPVVKEGDRVFDYSEARNYAAGLASNNFVAMPDCDEEYTRFDLDAINNAISSGFGQLEYNFVFAHDEYGAEMVKFMHCKFYDRTKLHWQGIIHEVLQGSAVGRFIDEDKLKLEHWQNPSQNRGHYLNGLALDCFLNPNNDRNSHYFGRELLYKGRFHSAIKEFHRHIGMKGWQQERAQSMVYIGDCKAALGDQESALDWYHRAFVSDGSRREPLIRLAEHFYRVGDRQKTAAFTAAALTVPWSRFYGNRMDHYTHQPHEMMYWALWDLDREASKKHWEQAIAHQPLNAKLINACQFYLEPALNLDAFRDAIRSKKHFAFVKIGDGEEQCMFNRQGQTCDGQMYSKALGACLRENYAQMAGKYHVVHWAQQDLVNLILHRKPNDLHKLKAFWGEIRRSKSIKVFIGPKRLEWVKTFLKCEFIEVPEQNAFDEIDRVMVDFRPYFRANSIAMFSCGPAAKVMIARVLKVPGTVTCLDCGSAFDPICGIESRTEQYCHTELRERYADWFKEDAQPGVSICIPTLGRENQLQQLLTIIPRTTLYPNFEIVIERDSFENRQGVAITLKRAVDRAKNNLILFLGNDCIPKTGFLKEAVSQFREPSLVALNDCFWKGQIATHWLASKSILPMLGGEFFHSGYHHVGCDNELTSRCIQMGLYSYCEKAIVEHRTAAQGQVEHDEVSRIAWEPKEVEKDRALLAARSKEIGFEVI